VLIGSASVVATAATSMLSAFATRRSVAMSQFKRAHDLHDAGQLDDALAVCDQVIERYGIEDEAGERALIAKFSWLRAAGRVEESEVVWDQVWRCLSDVPGQVQAASAWQHNGASARRCASHEDMRMATGELEIDLPLGLSPNQRYCALTSKIS
jgi:hypothetical protein